MSKHIRSSYTLQVNPRSGIVDRLSVPTDPEGINLVHINERTGFGAVVYTRKDTPPYMGPSDSPIGVESVHFEEYRAFASVVEESDDKIACYNPVSGHHLTYELHDNFFDILLDSDIAESQQIGLDLNVAFVDLRQTDPCEYQYNAKSPYRSEDRSLCYVYLERVNSPNLLITALNPAAGWRLIYGQSHAVEGLQMLARFDSKIDPTFQPGPVKFGVRVSFPKNLDEARKFISDQLAVPIITAPRLGGEIGEDIAFRVLGPVVGAELTSPDGSTQNIDLFDSIGHVKLHQEGFYTLRVWNEDGRGSDAIIHASVPLLECLKRTTANLQPCLGGFAEHSYWAQAFCLARTCLGPNKRHDDLLYNFLCDIGMQGLEVQGPPYPPAPEVSAKNLAPQQLQAVNIPAKENGWYLYAPCPEPHVYRGRQMSPFHIYMWERIQDAFALVQTYLFAAEAFRNDEFYEHAIRIANALITDNIDASGRVHVMHGESKIPIDYTTVIAPLQSLIELLIEMRERNDTRADDVRDICSKIGDFLVRRGLEFPTEGVSVHLRWTEDGSMTCTALSLLFAYLFVEKKPEYLEMARMVLEYHEAWRMDVPDVRILDSSYRYWETQWENDGEGRSINAGHPWTLWQAEALYYYAVASNNAKALLQSYNGFRTNICKCTPSGETYSCFTPDYIPYRLREFGVMHSYPQTSDPSIAFYLWPRIARTWMRSIGLINPADVDFPESLGTIVLGAQVLSYEPVLVLKSTSQIIDRFFWLDSGVSAVRLHVNKSIEIHYNTDALVEIVQGERIIDERERGRFMVKPVDGCIELRSISKVAETEI